MFVTLRPNDQARARPAAAMERGNRRGSVHCPEVENHESPIGTIKILAETLWRSPSVVVP